jgi:uncharacterized repeat protein (TIGR02543 family)
MIDLRAFAGCGSFSVITIPASVTYIGVDAFANCPKLTFHCYTESAAFYYAITARPEIDYVLLDAPVRQRVIVSFDARGGTTPYPRYREVTVGVSYHQLAVTTRANYDFVGWFSAPTGGVQVTGATFAPAKSHTLYARWSLKVYYVWLNPTGGTVDSSKQSCVTRQHGSAIGTLPTPVRTGYSFLGWYPSQAGSARVTKNTKIVKEVSFFARWQPRIYSVRLAANGGKLGTASMLSVKRSHDSTLGKLPTPVRAGYSFQGWYAGKIKGARVGAKTKVTTSVTYYARWKIRAYQVTYHATGGKVAGKASASVKRSYKSSLGRLPIPKKAGYQFAGWYTAKTKGVKVSAKTKIAKPITLYAHWKRRG